MKQGTSNVFYLLGLVLLFYGLKTSHILDVVIVDAPPAHSPGNGLTLIGCGVASLLIGLVGTVFRRR